MIRKNIISSGDSSGRVCIVTGTHGDELEGQYVCYKLANILNSNLDKLNGTVEIYPALNPLGVDTISRGIPGFDLDMNRIFPGKSDGVMAERAAYEILEDLKGADMVIDIHSSNIFLREMPQVRINVESADSLVPKAKELGVDFIWVHEAATVLEATLAHSLNSTGTPCLVVEMGVGMRINHSLGDKLVAGILNMLTRMGLWSGDVDISLLSEGIISIGDQVSFINADHSGIFITEHKTAEMVINANFHVVVMRGWGFHKASCYSSADLVGRVGFLGGDEDDAALARTTLATFAPSGFVLPSGFALPSDLAVPSGLLTLVGVTVVRLRRRLGLSLGTREISLRCSKGSWACSSKARASAQWVSRRAYCKISPQA